MSRKKAFVVSPYRIENWDGHIPYEVVFARSHEQAAAAYALHVCRHADVCDPELLGIDHANPEEPYVYRISIGACRLRHMLGPLYDELVEDGGPIVLSREHAPAAHEFLTRVFLGERG